MASSCQSRSQVPKQGFFAHGDSFLPDRQDKAEGRTLAFAGAFGADAAAMSFDHLFGDVETEAGAFGMLEHGAAAASEFVEEIGDIIGLYA